MPVSDRVHKDMHMRIHTREQPYTLSSHMLSHVGETPHIYTCSVCDKSLSLKRYLSTHMRNHTGERLCQCRICDGWFSGNIKLSRHMRIHTGEQP